MDNYVDILVPASHEVNNKCIQKYLATQLAKTKSSLKGQRAVEDFEIFSKSIFNLTSQVDDFLDGNEKKRSFLVLGQIQSGKTAHLLGTIAWAADSKISTCTIFTGVNNALNEQTIDRISTDLSALGDHFLKIFRIPTKHTGDDFRKLWKDVRKHISWRLEGNLASAPAPLPVFVLIKEKVRIETLKVLFEKISEDFGEDVANLLIDDEADQASQNAGASKRRIAQTYGAISSLLDVKSRLIMLSYTATPQAVMLTEKLGKLRPDNCVTVTPRYGYFGLDTVAGSTFSKQRIEVSDWNSSARNLSKRPRSLEKAILEFFILAWLRFNRPQFFYSNEEKLFNIENQLKSVQMLIHESSRQVRHGKMYDFVTAYIRDYSNQIREFAKSPETLFSNLEKYGFLEILRGLQIRIGFSDDLITDVQDIHDLFSIMNSTSVLVVNASKDRPNREIRLPVKNNEWEASRTWILIGGDILGRGLTIPQLISTYFLRTANKPNFDTVAQQMRFCGYREAYKNMISIYAPSDTFNSFRYMDVINQTVWKRARQWDHGRRDLRKNPPSIMYATPANFNMEPCRRSVRDPDLSDTSIHFGTIFSLRDIYRPHFVKENLLRLNLWVQECGVQGNSFEDWTLFEDVHAVHLQKLIGSLTANKEEFSKLMASAEIFDQDLGELGLEHSIVNIAIRNTALRGRINSIKEVDDFYNSIKIFRRISGKHEGLNLERWKKDFLRQEPQPISWPRLQTHIGDEQRALQKNLSTDCTLLIVEPIIGTSQTRDKSSGISVGIACTLLAPSSYEVRIIGHK